MVRVKVIGATGYTGGELIRLLLAHPQAEIVSLTDIGEKPTPLHDSFPQFRGVTDLMVQPREVSSQVEDGLDVVFFSVPDNIAHRLAPLYLDKGVKCIDLSADFRLQSVETHQAWYGFEHSTPHLVKEAVYGLPELFREEIKGARLVANPGCYPTGISLAMAPALRRSLIDRQSIICDCKSGVSGAGRRPSALMHFVERNENFAAYKIAQHRHIPEIEQVLSRVCNEPVKITFVPHLAPMTRGILETLYANLVGSPKVEEIRAFYADFYANEPLIRVLPEAQMPALANVVGTNFVDIYVAMDDHTNRLVVVSMFDNLLKGAAGQAVQNMNLICGLPETMALIAPAYCA